MSRRTDAPRDRAVLWLVALLVLAVLATSIVSGLVPGMDGAFAAWPIVVLVLIAGTIVVLARSIRR